MEQCPQCNTERVQDENFCDNCGHKYAETSVGESQQTPEQEQPTAEQEVQEQPTAEQEVQEQPTAEQEQPTPNALLTGDVQQGVLCIQDKTNGSNELSIHFDENPKVIGRSDMSEFVKDQGLDPLQVSRQQCTIFKEGDDYYIEDGVTSVQDKPSGNHTSVNGQDIFEKGKIKLNDQDKIVFATIVNAVFRIS